MGQEDQRLCSEGTLTLRGAEAFSGLSKAFLYKLMGEGELAFVRIGRSRRIPRRALVALLEDGLQGEGRDQAQPGAHQR